MSHAGTGRDAIHRTAIWPSLLFILLSAACWGFGTVLMKRALEEVGPLTLNVMMLTGSTALLWLLVALQRRPVGRGSDLKRIALLGLLHPGLVLTLGVVALDSLPAGLAGLIQASQPAMIILLAWLIWRDRPSRSLLSLTIVAAAGVILIIGGQIRLGDGTLTAAILMALAAAVASLVLVLVAGLVLRIHPLVVAAVQQSVGLIWAGAVLLINNHVLNGAVDPGFWRAEAWGWAVAAGGLFFAVGYWLYYQGLQAVPARVAGPFISLIPVFALLGGILFLDERLTGVQWLGALLIVGAITAISRRGAADAAPAG